MGHTLTPTLCVLLQFILFDIYTLMLINNDGGLEKG